jgi:hypothetical protein
MSITWKVLLAIRSPAVGSPVRIMNSEIEDLENLSQTLVVFSTNITSA